MKFVAKEDVTYQAIQWTGENLDEVKEFCGPNITDNGTCNYRPPCIWVRSIVGELFVEVGSYILKNPNYEGNSTNLELFSKEMFEKLYKEKDWCDLNGCE